MNKVDATDEHGGISSLTRNAIRIVNAVIKPLGMVSSFALGIMILIISIHVLGRYLFNKPLTGSIELVELLSVVVVFCSIAYTQLMKGHVTVDVLTRLMPWKVQRILISVMWFLGAFLFLALAWQGVILGQADVSPILATSTILSIPIAPFKFVLAIGAFIVGIKMLLDCFCVGGLETKSKSGGKS